MSLSKKKYCVYLVSESIVQAVDSFPALFLMGICGTQHGEQLISLLQSSLRVTLGEK